MISVRNAATGTTRTRRSSASVPHEKATTAVDSEAEGVFSKSSPPPDGQQAAGSSSSGIRGSDGESKGTGSRGRRTDDTSGSGTRPSVSDGFSSAGGTSSGNDEHLNQLIRDGNWRQILQLVQSSKKPVSNDQLRAIMRPAAEAGQHELLRRALERLTDAGLATSKDWAHLVRAHVAERKFHNAELALGEMIASGHKPEMAVFHDVLRAKASDLRRGDASVVLQRMAQCGMPPDLLTYHLALRMCYGGNAVAHADKILADMAAAGLAPDRHTFRAMLRACKGARDWRRALAVFSDIEVQHPALADRALWMCLLNTLSMCGQPQHTLAAAARMAERGFAPTATAHLFVVKAHAELGDGAAVEGVLSSARLMASDLALARFKAAEGYARGGHLDAAEEALEAALRSSSSGSSSSSSSSSVRATGAHMPAIVAFMGACDRARDLPRALRWLRRMPSLGVAPSPPVVQFAVSVAHDAGDAATADALWREVGGAAYFGLYKAMAPPRMGERRGWTVLMDHPVQQPHAQRTVLDLSSRTCVDGVLHAALRAEAARLRTQPPPATVYIYIAGATTPPRVARTAVFHALVASLGMHVSAVPPTAGLFKASVGAHEQTK